MLQNGNIIYAPPYTSLLVTAIRSEQDFMWKASIEQRKKKKKLHTSFTTICSEAKDMDSTFK